MSCHNPKYRRFPLLVRMIAAILVIAFFTQDIVWAHPDSLIPAKPSANNKLAAEFFSRDESSVGKALIRGVDELILKRAGESVGKAQNELSLDDIKGAASFFSGEKAGWFHDSNLNCRILKEEVIVHFQQGYSLRYFSYNPQHPNIEKGAGASVITTKPVSRKNLLYKQLLISVKNISQDETDLARRLSAMTPDEKELLGQERKAIQSIYGPFVRFVDGPDSEKEGAEGKTKPSPLPRRGEKRQYPYADWSAVERIIPDIVKGGGVAGPRLVTRKEEVALFEEVQKGNRAARDVLIEVNLGLVRDRVKKMMKLGIFISGLGITYGDLFSVGLCGYENDQGEFISGLMQAVDAFELKRGSKFSTYAYFKVKGSLASYIRRILSSTHKFNTTTRDLWQRVLEIEESNKNAQKADRRKELMDFVMHKIAPEVLTRREREIIRDYFALRKTPGNPTEEEVWRIPKINREIAGERGLSKERINQIRMAALQKLRNAIPPWIIKELGLASGETSKTGATPASIPDLSPNAPAAKDDSGRNPGPVPDPIPDLSPKPPDTSAQSHRSPLGQIAEPISNPNGVYIEYSYGKPFVDFSLNTQSANPWKYEIREGFKVGTGAYPRVPADFLPIIEHVIRQDKIFLEKSFKNIFGMSLNRTAIDNIRITYLHKGGLKYTFSVNIRFKDKRSFTFCVKMTYPDIDPDDRINLINSLMQWERAGRKAAQYIAAYGAHTTVYAGDFKSEITVISQEYVYGPMLLDILDAEAIPFADRAEAVRDAVNSCLEGHKVCGISIWDPKPGNLCLVYNSQRDWKLIDMDKVVTGEEYDQVTIRYREQYLEILANYYEEYLDFSTAELACNWAGILLRPKEGVYEKVKKAEDLIAEFASRNGLDDGVREKLAAVTTTVVTQMFTDNKNGAFAVRFVKDDACGAGVRLIARSYGNGIEDPKTLKEISLADNVSLESRGKRWERAAPNGFRQIGPSRVESGSRIGLTFFLRNGKSGDAIPISPEIDYGEIGIASFDSMTLEAIHDRHMSLIETKPVPSEKRVLLSANIFRPADGNLMEGRVEEIENRLALEAVLNKANILILEPDEIRKQVVKNNINRNNLTIVMTDTDYEAGKILNASEKTSWTKSGVLILQDRLIGANYLYLEGVVGLAKAMMRDDERAIKAFYQMLTGRVLSDEIADIAGKNPIAFAVNAMLKFKPMTPKDPEDLDRSRKRMEGYLISA